MMNPHNEWVKQNHVRTKAEYQPGNASDVNFGHHIRYVLGGELGRNLSITTMRLWRIGLWKYYGLKTL
jgi:hypothetical protein